MKMKQQTQIKKLNIIEAEVKKLIAENKKLKEENKKLLKNIKDKNIL
jgi:cell division septum initiation protein DivIVA